MVSIVRQLNKVVYPTVSLNLISLKKWTAVSNRKCLNQMVWNAGRSLTSGRWLSSAALSTSGTSDKGTLFLDRKVIEERVLTTVRNFEKVDKSKVTATSSFSRDLGLDSLDTVEVVMAFEDEFNIEIPDADADKILSVQDAISFIASQPNAK